MEGEECIEERDGIGAVRGEEIIPAEPTPCPIPPTACPRPCPSPPTRPPTRLPGRNGLVGVRSS